MADLKGLRILSALLCLLLLTACAAPVASDAPAAPMASVAAVPGWASVTVGETEEAPFQVQMLDVGQGLSVLIRADGDCLLYDGGGRSASSYVVSYLKQHGVEELDYMVVSHYDEDHLSGLVGVLNTTGVETVVSPDYRADTKLYESFRKMVRNSGAKTVHPAPGDTFSLGQADIQVLGPKTCRYAEENDRSVVIRVQYGAFSCLLTGDAEREAEADMLASGLTLDSDLYVVGHHGSSSSSSKGFVEAVSPGYAFLSVGTDNAYGHPTEKTLTTLRDNHVRLFRTDVQGELTACSDGETCWFSAEPCADWSSGASAAEPEDQDGPVSPSAGYVLNRNSRVFHLPDCPSVPQIKETNRKYVRDSRETLMKQGNRPCRTCKP